MKIFFFRVLERDIRRFLLLEIYFNRLEEVQNIDLSTHFFLGDIVSILFFFLLFLLTAIDNASGADDTLERLRNITKMFSTKDNDEPQQLKKMEKFAPGDKIKNTFQK